MNTPKNRSGNHETELSFDVVVIGAGQAGLARATSWRQGRRFVIPEAALRRRGLAGALGLAHPVHAAPLRRASRPSVPRRSRRLPDARRGGRLPGGVRGHVRAPVELQAPSGSLTTDRRDGSSSNSTAGQSRPTRSSSPPARSRRRTCRARRRARAGGLPVHSDRLPHGRATSPRGPCSSSAAATPASRSRRSSRRRTRCVLAVGSRQKPLPQRLLGRDLFWWLTKPGLINKTVDSRIGRRSQDRDTLIGSSPRELTRRYGVELKPRAVGAVRAHGPLRRRQRARGRRRDLGDRVPARPLLDRSSGLRSRRPVRHRRGVTDVPGLYFLGLSWQHTRGSALIGWVKDDAEFIAEQIAASQRHGRKPTPATRTQPAPRAEHRGGLTCTTTTHEHTPTTELPDATRRACPRRRGPRSSSSPTATSSTSDRARSPSGSATRPCGCSPTTARFPARRSGCRRARAHRPRHRTDGDLEATVHWHGLRLDNRYDGTHETQAPIPVGETFTYESASPTPASTGTTRTSARTTARRWASTGTSSSTRPSPTTGRPSHREVLPHARRHPDRGRADRPLQPRRDDARRDGPLRQRHARRRRARARADASRGEVVRLYLTNTANTRVFNVALPGARMKLVGGDSGHYEREEFVDEVMLAPSERAVVDVLFDEPGELDARAPDARAHLPARRRSPSATSAGGAAARRGSSSSCARTPTWSPSGERLAPSSSAEPDKTLAFVAEMDLGSAREGDGRLRLPDAPGGRQRGAGTLPEVRHEAPRHAPPRRRPSPARCIPRSSSDVSPTAARSAA